MLQGFEDAFTDAQARTISLALELLENNKKEADMIYIYIYQSDTQIFFNAFFAKDKKIYLLNDWFDDDQINDFFDCGVEDVDNIVEVCDTYNGKCPYEFKLSYNVKTKSFDAKYNYDDIAMENDVDLVDIYKEWQKECESEISCNWDCQHLMFRTKSMENYSIDILKTNNKNK